MRAKKKKKGLSKQKRHSETVLRDIEPFPLFLLPMELRDSLSDEHLRSNSTSGSRSWLSKRERARECEERECKCERGRRDGRVRCFLSIWSRSEALPSRVLPIVSDTRAGQSTCRMAHELSTPT